MLKAASVISACTLLSRVLGLVRDALMWRMFGVTWISGTFLIAWMVPNLLRRLFGEGALSASFVPAYAKSDDEPDGSARADALLGAVAGTLLLVLSALALVVIAACLLLPADWLGQVGDDPPATATETGGLLLRLIAIVFPYTVLICTTAILGGALNSLRVFGWPAAMPIVLNVFWLGGLAAASFALDDHQSQITLVAVFLLAGGGAQLAILTWRLHRRGRLPRLRLPQPGDPARAVFRAMAPAMLGMSVVQISTLIDQGFAYWLIGGGQNNHLYMGNRLLLFPHALTSLALATVAFPSFAVLANRSELGELRASVDRALRLTVFLALPASAGMALVANDFIVVAFVGNQYTADDASLGTACTVAMVAGLPLISAAQLLARAHYAIADMRGPALVSVAILPLNIALNCLFLFVFDLGVSGLAWATTACSLLNAAWLRVRFAKACPGPAIAHASLATMAAATGVMVAAVLGVQALMPESNTSRLVRLAVSVTVGIAAYFAMAWLVRSPELREVTRRGR